MYKEVLHTFKEQLSYRANPLLVELVDKTNHLIIKSEGGEITIISKDFLDIKTISNSIDKVIGFLENKGGGIIDFNILSPDKIHINYKLL